jgi:chemotaxis protein MotB
MRTPYFFTLVVFFATLTFLQSSCVSKKKYRYSQSRVSDLQADSTRLDGRVASLMADKENLQQQLVENQERAKELAQTLEGREKEIKQKELLLDRQNNLLYEKAQQLTELQDKINQQNQIVEKLRNTIANALVNFRDDELTVHVKEGKVYLSLSENLLFKSGSATIDQKGKEALGKLSGVLNNNPDIEILIEGHTDSIPISSTVYRDNWDLSVARATSIVRVLANDYQVDGKRLTASGRADNEPVDTNTTKEGRAKNRRTEIILSPKLEELFQLIDSSPRSLN